jgi:RND family efflux transporter MFP subunit
LVTIGLGVAIAGVILYGATREVPEPPSPPKRLANVEVATVRPQTYRESLVLPAKVEADRVAAVSPEFAGRLSRWLVAEGQRVEGGQVVAELDTEVLDASLRELLAKRSSAALAVRQASAALEGARVALNSARKQVEVQELTRQGAEADLQLARADHDRVQSLVDQKVMDRARLDTARNTLTQAEVRLSQAREGVTSAKLAVDGAEVGVEEGKARLALAESTGTELDAAIASLRVHLAKSRLRAPVSGRLEAHLAEPGEFVDGGKPVARVYDLARVKAVVQVPDRYVAFLDVGNPAGREFIRQNRPGAVQEVRARLVVPGLPKLTGGENRGIELPAEVTRIAQAADPASNTFAVELGAENPGEALKHGVIARGVIEYLTFPEALIVPLQAVQVTDAGPRVLVVESRDGRSFARERTIVPGSIQEDRVQVLDGVTAGERLIVSGWKGLAGGTEVNVMVQDGVFLGVGGGGDNP